MEAKLPELLNAANIAYSHRPPLAEKYIDEAYELEPNEHSVIIFRLKVKIYTQYNNDSLFDEAFNIIKENDELFISLIKTYYEYLLFNNRFKDLKEAFKKYSNVYDNEIQLYQLYVEYIEKLDIKVFLKITGFNESERETFFGFFTNFPIRSSDVSRFIAIIKRFFSQQTLLLYKTFISVQTNNYNNKKWDEGFSDIAFKYILDGNLDLGWKRKIFNTFGIISNPEYFDLKKCNPDQDLNNKTILISSEQGFGDNIIYYRMWTKLFEKYPDTTFIYTICGELYKLFAENLKEYANVKAYDRKEHYDEYTQLEYDSYYPDFTVPYLLKLKKNSLESFKGITLKNKIVLPEKSIGLFWHTRIRQNFIKYKILPLEVFYEGLNLKAYQDQGYQLYSLQKEHTDHDLYLMKKYNILDISEELNSFYETAEYIEAMDKIYTIDTSIMHLTKALEKEVTAVFNFYKGYHYDKKGLYPNINKIYLEEKYFKYLNGLLI